MLKFIRLTNTAINISHISKICIQKDKYVIHVNDNKIDGIYLFGFGTIFTTRSIIEICKINNHPDFHRISKFIDKHQNNDMI